MADTLGSLLVEIGASTARLERDLAKARNDVSKWANGVTSTVKGLGAALAGAFTVDVAVQVLQKNLDFADSMAKLSQSVGVSVEKLTAYSYAADLSGVSVEKVGKAIGQMSRKMVEAAEGSGEGKKAFEALGLSTTDAAGRLLDSDKMLEKIADRFAKMPDGPAKTAAAMDLFGKAGAEMIPMLNSGSSGLAQMRGEAERLGLVLDTETAKAAERINDNFARVRMSVSGMATKITVGLIPTLDNLAKMMAEARRETEDTSLASDALGAGLKIIASGAVVVKEVFRSAGSYVAAFAASIDALIDGEFRRAYDVLSIGGRDIADSVAESIGTIGRIWDDAGNSSASGSQKLVSALQPVVTATGKGAEAAKKMKAEYQSLFDKLNSASLRNVQNETRRLEDDVEGSLEAFQGIAVQLQSTGGVMANITAGLSLYNHETDRNIDLTTKMGDKAATVYDDMKNAVSGWASNFSSTLTDMVWSAEVSFGKILEAFGKMMTQVVIQKSVVEPMLKGFGLLPNAHGNVFVGGHLQAFANGGIVSRPTVFPMARGMGLMGEAGPEAIMPLKRGADGRLGVSAQGGGTIVQVINNTPAQARTERSTGPDGRELVRIVIDAVKQDVAHGGFDRLMGNTFGLVRRGA